MNALILSLLFILALLGDWIFTTTGACTALFIACVMILGHLFFKHKREAWEREKERKEFDEREIYK